MKALDLLKETLEVNKTIRENERYGKDILYAVAAELLISKYEEAIKELEDLIAKDNQKNCEECYYKTDKALTAIESQSSCDGCIHKPKQGENYYDPCGECKRFYGDCYTRTEDEED